MDGANNNKATVMKSAPVPTIFNITSPNGGETFTSGNQFTATWITSSGFYPTDNLSFELVNQTTNLNYLLTASTPNDGIESFTIPLNIPSGQYKLYGEFLNSTFYDYSDNSFTILLVPNNSDWTNVGNPEFSVGNASFTTFALDSNNTPYVAYSDGANNNKATVMKFDGTNWVSVGNPGFSAGQALYTSVALDLNNTPYVAYADDANNGKETVMKFDGTNWVYVGNPGFSALNIKKSSLKIDSNNVLYVAFIEYEYTGGGAIVMKFDGTNWVYVGNPDFSIGLVENISLAINSNNIPYVTYEDWSYSYSFGKATVMKFDGTNWVNVGNPGFSAGGIYEPSISIDSSSIPYVAYVDDANNYKATVMKFDGTNWVLVGNSGFSPGQIFGPSIDFDSNNIPYIAYMDSVNNDKATVMKFNGANWIDIGNPGFSEDQAQDISLVIDSNNIPYVAFSNDDTISSSKATVMKYIQSTTTCSLTIVSPNGGENFIAGNQFTANWNSVGFQPTDNLSFDLVNQSNNAVYTLTSSTSNDGTETFTIGNIPTGQYKLHAQFLVLAVGDYSDNPFNIINVFITPITKFTITSPNGGESFNAGGQFLATWDWLYSPMTGVAPYPYTPEEVYFELVEKDTNNAYSIVNSTLNDGKEELTMPSNIQPGVYLLHGGIIGTNLEDYSDGTITVN